jgi:hypothetical protein
VQEFIDIAATAMEADDLESCWVNLTAALERFCDFKDAE